MAVPFQIEHVFGDLGAMIIARRWLVVFERAIVAAPLPEMVEDSGRLSPAVDAPGEDQPGTYDTDPVVGFPDLPRLRAGSLKAWEIIRTRVTLEVALGGREDDSPVVGTEMAAALLGVSRDTVDGIIRRLLPKKRPANCGTGTKARYWWRDRATLLTWWEEATTSDREDKARARAPRKPRAERRVEEHVDFQALAGELKGQ